MESTYGKIIKDRARKEITKLLLLDYLEETKPWIIFLKGESCKLGTIFVQYCETKGGVLGIL